jgi:hypothetical protein
MDYAALRKIPEEEFVVGLDMTYDDLDVDKIFAKKLDRLLKDAVAFQKDALDRPEDSIQTKSLLCPGVVFEDVEDGLIARDATGRIVGGYISTDVSLAEDFMGKGLGKELILEYFLRNESFPVWSLEAPAFSPAGLGAHRAAHRLIRESPSLVQQKIALLAIAEEARATISSAPSFRPSM